MLSSLPQWMITCASLLVTRLPWQVCVCVCSFVLMIYSSVHNVKQCVYLPYFLSYLCLFLCWLSNGTFLSCLFLLVHYSFLHPLLIFLLIPFLLLTVKRKIRHDNQTGRWLTTFKARFVPTRDDLVFVGSMMQPRRVSVCVYVYTT